MKIKPNILVMEKDPADIKLLKGLLERKGYDIAAVRDSREALDKVFDGGVDLVIMDMLMTEVDPFEMTKKIRANGNTRHLPIILSMPSEKPADRDKGIKAGCDDFITKPFDENEVALRVSTLLKISYFRPLLNEKEKFEYVLNHIDDGIVIFDDRMGLVHANQKANELLSAGDAGAHKGDFIGYLGERFKIRYDGDLRQDIKTRALSFDIERPPTHLVKALVLAVRISVVRNPMGEISNIVMILNDVTEERREDMLKQNFLDLISHKLRTPIAIISENAAMLENEMLGSLNSDQKTSVGGILSKSYALGGLVDKLLGFATINSDKFDTAKESVGLKSFLQASCVPLVKSEKEKKIFLSIDCPDDNLTLRINKLYFGLIITNLVENAIKFSDKSVIKITIAAGKAGDATQVSVSDNGPGIPPEEKDKVFRRFYQIERYFTGNVEGAGLGLALVKYLVKANEGSIRLESEAGKGATFIMGFPG
ncbi:ATP-binding protein [Candidatus Omnitrophota bacterium]